MNFEDEQVIALDEHLQDAGADVLNARGGKGSDALSMASSGADPSQQKFTRHHCAAIGHDDDGTRRQCDAARPLAADPGELGARPLAADLGDGQVRPLAADPFVQRIESESESESESDSAEEQQRQQQLQELLGAMLLRVHGLADLPDEFRKRERLVTQKLVEKAGAHIREFGLVACYATLAELERCFCLESLP